MRPCRLCFDPIIHEEQRSTEIYFEGQLIDRLPCTEDGCGPLRFLQETDAFGLILASSDKSIDFCTRFVQRRTVFVGQAAQKAIRTEVDAPETALPPPRFDEAAEQQARPVVPLDAEPLPANYVSTTNRGLQLKPLLSKKGSWLLAAFVGLVLTAGVMTVGVTTYRRSQSVPTQSLAPTAEAVRIELNQELRSSRSVSSRAPASRSNAPAIVRTIKRAQPTRPIYNGTPRPRLVDSYVVRRPHR
jgi:hypothetical protein